MFKRSCANRGLPSHSRNHARQDFEHLPPEQLADDILRKEARIAELMREIQGLLADKG